MANVVNPYSFVPLGTAPARTSLDACYTGPLLTGRLDYTLTTDTPLLIPDSAKVVKDEKIDHKRYPFFRLPDGTPAIPGSEMRGAMRGVYEAVTNSCLSVLLDSTEEPFSQRLPSTNGFKDHGLLGIDPETGKPIAKSVLARTQRECKEKLQKAMEELEKIDITKRRDYTVGEWVQIWYENYAKPSVRASTAAYYKNYIDQHIVPRIGDIKLAALTTLQIQKFYNETKAHGRVQRYENMNDLSLSNKTIRGLHTMLRQCLEQAVTERLIPYNPANGRLPKKEKKKMQIIPPEKIRDYLKAAEEWGVLPMFYLELSTGLRRGELVALLWSDLNLQTKTLTVSKSVSRGKGELVVTEPKTENSVREIYLSDEALRLLVEDRKNHPFSPYMFPSPKTGGMYGPDCVGRIHKKLLEKAGIEEHVRFHDLRHTFSTLAIQSGIDPKTVAEILGHASAEFSLDVYAAI